MTDRQKESSDDKQSWVKGDVIDEIHSIIETYHSMISCSITIESKPRTPKFIYTGFHRSLFDSIWT